MYSFPVAPRPDPRAIHYRREAERIARLADRPDAAGGARYREAAEAYRRLAEALDPTFEPVEPQALAPA